MFTRYFFIIFLFSLNLLAAYQPVTTVSGTVAVSNFPAVQVVSGTVSATIDQTNLAKESKQDDAIAELISIKDAAENINGAIQTPYIPYDFSKTLIVGGYDNSVVSQTVTPFVFDNGYALTSEKNVLDISAANNSSLAVKGAQLAGSDGSSARFIKTDNQGELQIDVLSLPAITGTVTANAGTNLNTSALALESGGNLATIASRTPALGQTTMTGSQPVVIASNQSTLPVSGTVSQNGTWNINNISGTVSLPTGAATSANQTNVQAVDGGTPPASALVVGGVTAGGVFQTFETNGSGHLNIADGGGSLTVDNAGTFAVQAAQSGGWTVTANAGTNLNTSALALESGGNLAAAATSLGLIDNAVAGSELQVDVVAALPAGTNNIGDVDVLSVPSNMSINQTQVNGVAVSTGNGTVGTGVQRVAIASDNTAFNVLNTEVRPSTATTTSVAASATSVTCLASNSARRMATFFNDSTATAYLKFGATASTSSHAVQILGGGYYEMPYPTYTGIIDCIWASATGNMRVTEY